jgi:hypothetical protein
MEVQTMASSEGPAWEVVSQREDYGQSDTGTFVAGVVVTFRTRSGHTGSVFVPAMAYTVDEARKRIAAKADEVEAIAQLKG